MQKKELSCSDDGTHGNKTLTGNVSYAFVGSTDENGLFQATGYEYWTDEKGVTFSGDATDITAIIDSTSPVSGAFSSKSVGGISLNLTFEMSDGKPAGIVSEDLQVVKLQAPTAGNIRTESSTATSITDILGDLTEYEDVVAGADEEDLSGMLEYASDIAQLRNREKLWWAGTGATLDGWTSEDAVYDTDAKTMTFDITLTDYGYNTTGKTVSGNIQLIFHGEEATVDGKPVLNATTWQIISDEALEFEGGAASLNVSSIDLTGPIVKGKTIGGDPATITFPINGTQRDRTEFPSDSTSYIVKYQPDQFIGFSGLYGNCMFNDDKLSGEMFNVLINKYIN